MPELSPRVFSFNSPLGACSSCQGLGVQRQFNIELIVDGNMSVSNGCVIPWRQSMSPSWYRKLLECTCEH
jgi:excinuclease ABC subunit A